MNDQPLSERPLSALALWRASKDPLLAPLAPDDLITAGFFDDGASEGDLEAFEAHVRAAARGEVRWTEGVDRPDRSGRPLAAALLCGALNPPHAGHVSAVTEAGQLLEAAGWNVIGTVLAPDHQTYIDQKTARSGLTAFDFERRFALARAFGVAVTRAATVMPYPVNFTDVGRLLAAELSAAASQPVTVWQVFGSDNAGFALTACEAQPCILAVRTAASPLSGDVERRLSQSPWVLRQPINPQTAAISSSALQRAAQQGPPHP